MRSVLIVAAVCALLVTSGPVLAKSCKIGTIDVPRILEEYEGYEQARKELDRLRDEREEEFGRRRAELQKLGERIQEGAKLLSKAKRRQKEQEYMRKAQALKEWQLKQGKELQEKDEGLIKRLESDVRAALKTIGTKGKFSFVVRSDLLLFVNGDAEDLTDKVLTVLRRQSKK